MQMAHSAHIDRPVKYRTEPFGRVKPGARHAVHVELMPDVVADVGLHLLNMWRPWTPTWASGARGGGDVRIFECLFDSAKRRLQ